MFAFVKDDVSDYPSLLLDPCVLSMIQMLVLDKLFECSFPVWTLSLIKAGWRWNALKSSNMMEKYAPTPFSKAHPTCTLQDDILQIVNCDQGLWHADWWTAELTTDKLARGLELLRVFRENVFEWAFRTPPTSSPLDHGEWNTYIGSLRIYSFKLFIGPRSDHSLPMSVTNWLTHSLTHSLTTLLKT